MQTHFGSLVFTPVIKTLQERYGSRPQYARREPGDALPDRLSLPEQQFIGEADHFYMASVGQTGWPYIQHRGGPEGFLKVIDEGTFAFADFRGNKQYISTGNLMTDNRVALILIDYPRQARLKILGRAEILEADQAKAWIAQLRDPAYKAVIERVFIIHVEAFDWNCQQHITPRFTASQIRDALEPIEQQLRLTQQENEKLRVELARLTPSAEQSSRGEQARSPHSKLPKAGPPAKIQEDGKNSSAL